MSLWDLHRKDAMQMEFFLLLVGIVDFLFLMVEYNILLFSLLFMKGESKKMTFILLKKVLTNLSCLLLQCI